MICGIGLWLEEFIYYFEFNLEMMGFKVFVWDEIKDICFFGVMSFLLFCY